MNLTTTGSYCLLFIFLIFKVEAQTVTLEMEFDSNKIQQGDYMSPVTTYKNSIYTVWIDDKSRLVIAKKSNGLTTTKVIFASGVPDDPFHVAPSIGIDRDSYIHIAGNMHHSPFNNLDENPYKDIAWQYWVSDKPEDISSFSFKGDTQQAPPGNWVSYPNFQRGGIGHLYVVFRHRFSFNGSWIGEVMAGEVARCESNNRTWTMLGGITYRRGIKTLAWTGKPTSVTAYKGYKPTLSSGLIPVGISFNGSNMDNIIECNIMDGDVNIRWSAEGDGQCIMFDLGSVKSFDRVDIAFYKGNERTVNFDIQYPPTELL